MVERQWLVRGGQLATRVYACVGASRRAAGAALALHDVLVADSRPRRLGRRLRLERTAEHGVERRHVVHAHRRPVDTSAARVVHRPRRYIINESALSFLRAPTTWHCPHSPAAAAERRPSRNRSISPARRAHSSKPLHRHTMRTPIGRAAKS